MKNRLKVLRAERDWTQADLALHSFLTYLLIAVWFVPFTFLAAFETNSKKRKCGHKFN